MIAPSYKLILEPDGTYTLQLRGLVLSPEEAIDYVAKLESALQPESYIPHDHSPSRHDHLPIQS